MKRFSISLILHASALALFLSAAIPAFAQDSAHGTFTLSRAAKWGSMDLPAGTYTYAVEIDGGFTKVCLADSSGKLLGYAVGRPDYFSGDPRVDNLTLTSAGRLVYVSALQVSEMGVRILFPLPSVKNEQMAKYVAADSGPTTFAAAK